MKTVPNMVPGLSDLPAPPPGRTGWPWTEASSPVMAIPPGGGSWPRISIVTPSFNQGIYLEETIRSVLLQGYPDVEYFIIDGGSTDESVEIIRKYEPWLAGWVSERDDGQSHAINKGFTRSRGEIFNWLCSDDLLTKGALQAVANRFSREPDADVVAGGCFLQYDDEPARSGVRKVDGSHWRHAPFSGVIWQPSCFFRRELVSRDSLVLADLHYCMDRELWTYLWSRDTVWKWEDDVFSVYRFSGVNKSSIGGHKILHELETIYRAYFEDTRALPCLLRKCWLPLVRAHRRHRQWAVRLFCRILSRSVTTLLLVFYPASRVRALQRDFYHYGC